MTPLIQSSPPTRHRESHIYVQPHAARTSSRLAGITSSLGGSATDSTAFTFMAIPTSLTVQTFPWFCASWSTLYIRSIYLTCFLCQTDLMKHRCPSASPSCVAAFSSMYRSHLQSQILYTLCSHQPNLSWMLSIGTIDSRVAFESMKPFLGVFFTGTFTVDHSTCGPPSSPNIQIEFF